jgi:hypothetical protein
MLSITFKETGGLKMNYRFSDAEASWLLDLVVGKVIEVASRARQEFATVETHMPSLLLWCRVTAELHEPSPRVDLSVSEAAPNRFGVDVREMTTREGIDIDKELGPIDPRAFKPRCIHGRFFTDLCNECASRCSHGITLDMPCFPCNRGVAVDLERILDPTDSSPADPVPASGASGVETDY